LVENVLRKEQKAFFYKETGTLKCKGEDEGEDVVGEGESEREEEVVDVISRQVTLAQELKGLAHKF